MHQSRVKRFLPKIVYVCFNTAWCAGSVDMPHQMAHWLQERQSKSHLTLSELSCSKPTIWYFQQVKTNTNNYLQMVFDPGLTHILSHTTIKFWKYTQKCSGKFNLYGRSKLSRDRCTFYPLMRSTNIYIMFKMRPIVYACSSRIYKGRFIEHITLQNILQWGGPSRPDITHSSHLETRGMLL